MTKTLECAISRLKGETTLVLSSEKDIVSMTGRGISSMLFCLDNKLIWLGYDVADTVVGKAVATLFVYAKVNSVYAKMISKGALDYLKNHGVDVYYDSLVPNILNRDKTDICPMEKAVENIDDPKTAYKTLKTKYNEMISR